MVYFPPVTPEGLYHQDKRKRQSDNQTRALIAFNTLDRHSLDPGILRLAQAMQLICPPSQNPN